VGSVWKPAPDIRLEPVDIGGLAGEFSLAPGSDPSRVLLFFHGGGYCSGSIASHRRLVTEAGRATRIRTLAIGYRLAPEHPFPAAHEDAVAAWQYLAALGIPAEQIAVGGDSAGGNLAAVVSQMALDSNEFKIALQLLIYPMTDQSRDYPSYQRNASGYMLTRAALYWFMDNYIPDCEDRKDPMASPMLRPSLKGLPPALIIAAEFDPLVDENGAYANRLKEAGVACDYVCFPGMIHPFFTLGGVVEDAAKAEALAAAALKKLA